MTVSTYIMTAATAFLAIITGVYHTRRWWRFLVNRICRPIPFADFYLTLVGRPDAWLRLEGRFRGRSTTVTGQMSYPGPKHEESEYRLYQIGHPEEAKSFTSLTGAVPSVWAYEQDIISVTKNCLQSEDGGKGDCTTLRSVRMTGRIQAISTVPTVGHRPSQPAHEGPDRPFIRLVDVTVLECSSTR